MPTLQFKGKSFVENHHLTVPYHQLIPDKAFSLTEKVSLSDNLIVHGDNLVALKALLPNYQGRVKCIYIDPPYNTGKEGWLYSDNVNSPMIQEWLMQNKPVDKEDLTRHDKWLCMMMPRLTLLRELLSNEGVIFVSIDDNEAHHLRMLMDEIFGEAAFVADISVINNMKGRNDRAHIATAHEHLLMYAKPAFESLGISLTEAQIAEYSNVDENGKAFQWRDLRRRGGADTRAARPKLFYPIYVNPTTGEVLLKRDETHTVEVLPVRSDGTDGRWRWSKEKVANNLSRIRAAKLRDKDKWNISYRVYLEENGKKRTAKPKSVWIGSQYSTDSATKTLRALVPSAEKFTPKSVEFIVELLQQATKDGDIILDSFAGSGTTGHATLLLNSRDNRKRKFILIETEDYANSLTAERIRKVIEGVPDARDKGLRKGIDGTFSFFRLGESIDIEAVLSGDPKLMPAYSELARYLFYTSTGEEFVPENLDESRNYIGESQHYQVYLFYKPDVEYLQNTALTLEIVRALPNIDEKERLVFAPTHFVDSEYLDQYRVRFVRLPFEIYRFPSS